MRIAKRKAVADPCGAIDRDEQKRMGGFNPDNPTALWVRAQLADAIGRAIRAGFRSLPLLPAGRWDSTTGPPAPSLISSSTDPGTAMCGACQSRKELAALIQRTHAAVGEVQYISAPGYDPQKLTIRDHWMIDRAHAIIVG